MVSICVFRAIGLMSVLGREIRLVFCRCFDYWLVFCVVLPTAAALSSAAYDLSGRRPQGMWIVAVALPWLLWLAVMQRMSRIRLAVEEVCESRGWLDRVVVPVSPRLMFARGVVAFILMYSTLIAVGVAWGSVHPDPSFGGSMREDALPLLAILAVLMAGLAWLATMNRLRGGD